MGMGEEIIDFLEHLPSGLTVVHDDIPSVGTTALAFFVAVGSRDEEPREWGAAHLLEHLLFKGAGDLDYRAIARQMDKLGGDINAFTTRDYTCFYARVLDSEASTAYRLLTTMISAAWLRDEDLSREKNVVREEMRESQDDPDEVLDLLMTEALYAELSFSHDILGTAASLAAISGDLLRTFYRRYYQPQNMVFAVSGGARSTVLQLLQQDFSGGNSSTALPRQRPRPHHHFNTKEFTADWEQLHIGLAAPAPHRDDPEYYGALVAASILGGQNSSRLWQKLREEEGLVYTVATQYSAELNFGDMTTYLSLGPEHVQHALATLQGEFEKLGDVGPEESELARTCASLYTMLVMAQETPDARVMRLGRYGLDQQLPPVLDVVKQHLLQVDALTLKTQVARWTEGERRAVAWAGPKVLSPESITHLLGKGVDHA